MTADTIPANGSPADPFDDPGESGFFGGDAKKRLNGSLLVFEVTEFIPDFPTVQSKPNEANPAVRANIHVVDGEHKGEYIENAPIFGAMIEALRTRVNRKVIGRLGQGTAKQGKSAPWTLEKATPEERQAGAAYMRQLEAAKPDPFTGP
jgi:hypothetical protein